ncbi:PR domain zinc finger protein 4 [Parasteatoda tepidariorum]|uniref:PR domain zinc finger protein 4 n=1 Tax=Parasteatoda tepidariorum TaxID=114398 RepID=UPI001C7215BD|nr:PR domain zinc finger protein 4-like [Parasteatoda tepidariorum]
MECLGSVRYDNRRTQLQTTPPELLAFLNRPGLQISVSGASGVKNFAEPVARAQPKNVEQRGIEPRNLEPPGGSKYHCEFCNFETTSIQRLHNHLEEHKSSVVHRCTLCSKVFKSLANLQNHMPTHDRVFTCDYCEKKFKHQSSLRAHIKTHFPFEQKCPICDKVLTSDAAFKKHMYSHQLQ